MVPWTDERDDHMAQAETYNVGVKITKLKTFTFFFMIGVLRGLAPDTHSQENWSSQIIHYINPLYIMMFQ